MIDQLKDKATNFWAIKKNKYISFGVLAILAIVLIVKGSSQKTVSVEVVKKQDLQRTVLASGTVVSSTDLSLSFDLAGTVQSVKVKVGDKVKKGDALLILANSEQRAAVTSARGVLLAAQARYKRVLDGSSNEEIALAEVNLKNAKNDYTQTKKTQDTLVENARRLVLSAGLVAENANNSGSLTLPTISGTYSGEEGQYILNYSGGDYLTYSGIESGIAKVSTITPMPLGNYGLNIIFPTTTSLTGSSWKINIPNKSGLTYSQNLNTYNAAINARDQGLANSQATIDQRQAELDLKRATARQADIDAALADIVTAQAGLESAQAKLDKTYLIAPTTGTITVVDVKLGETAQPQKQAIVLQDVGSLYLEANISENNIGNIALGQMVTVSYDAIKDKLFSATISSIDPSATKVGDSVNYKIKALITDTNGILPGMTANMSILTAEIKGALVIPNRVIDYTGEKPAVDVYADARKKQTTRKTVEVGLKGDGDIIEIKNGLTEGESVVWTPAK